MPCKKGSAFHELFYIISSIKTCFYIHVFLSTSRTWGKCSGKQCAHVQAPLVLGFYLMFVCILQWSFYNSTYIVYVYITRLKSQNVRIRAYGRIHRTNRGALSGQFPISGKRQAMSINGQLINASKWKILVEKYDLSRSYRIRDGLLNKIRVRLRQKTSRERIPLEYDFRSTISKRFFSYWQVIGKKSHYHKLVETLRFRSVSHEQLLR